MSQPRILIIIPAHNEEASLGSVIDGIRDALAADIAVIDDGSSDGTGRIALGRRADLLRLPFNLGIGTAVQTGFQLAAREGYDIAVQVDGDGQHDPAQIAKLVAPIIAGDCDMTVGSRYLEENSYDGAAGRRLGTAIFSMMVSLMVGQKLTDATSGFRAVNRCLLEHFARDYPRDYPEVEALLLAHKARCRIREIPVTMRSRKGGRSSISRFRSVYYMVKVLLALIVAASRKRSPGADCITDSKSRPGA